MCREKLSADSEAVTSFKTQLQKIIDEELSLDQVYNCDETGLNYRMLLSKTLAAKQETFAPGYKKSNDRVTVVACSNATGEQKLLLMLIGKAAKPRASKNISVTALPVMYRNKQKFLDRPSHISTVVF